MPLLIITLARPELLERRPGWGTSARAFNAIGLEPLGDHHMRELLIGLVPELPDAAVRSVLARADGIPLYAVETVRMLIADGRLVPAGDGTYRPAGDLGELAVPDSLRALVASRLDALDPLDRSLLQDAAVLGKTFPTDALAAISGEDAAALEPRLRSLVRREILEVSEDPRSPERGQYGFVQSVIREVAYETLSRRDRRARHLAAARYFEGHGDEELAGVLATHYLAAHQASDEGPEADALQAQARLTLRAAAERAVTLGAADQAVVCLRQALDITAVQADRAELLERTAAALDLEARYEEADDAARQALAAYQALGDRSGVARMSALLGAILANGSQIVEAAAFLEDALQHAEAPEDIETRAEILVRLSRAHMRLGQDEQAIRRADEALAIAEPRRLDRVVADAFVNKGAALQGMGRIREPVVLSRAAVELAAQAGDTALELRARNNHAAGLLAEDTLGSIEAIREALELATRVGNQQMEQWIAGTFAIACIYAGTEWDASLAVLDATLERSRSNADRAHLLWIRGIIMTWRGEDTTALDVEFRVLRESVSDPDFEAWSHTLPALKAMLDGRLGDAIAGFRRAIPLAVQQVSDARVGLIRAAHWARDLEAAREGLREADAETFAGRFIDAERALGRAGVAALEGRRDEALAAFHESVEHSRAQGSGLDAAMAQLSALILMPEEPTIAAWADEARQRFEIVKSPPLLARVDEAVAARVG